MTNTDALIRDLAAAAPALADLLAEHRADQGGELLPHLYMADVTRWLAAGVESRLVLAVLERHLAEGDEDVQNVIALSFLENLGPEHVSIRAALGPGLRAELDALESWTRGSPESAT
jgi:hypothetical protein